MLIDLTLEISRDNLPVDDSFDMRALLDAGHVGTHFDVAGKKFPLESFRTRGKLIDISHIRDREVEVADLADQPIEEGDMIIFHTGYIDEIGYGQKGYIQKSAELSDEAVAYLIERKVRLIGVDAAGVQKLKKHAKVDQYCADRGVFIVENLCNLKRLMPVASQGFTVYTAPVNRSDLSGLPSRVVAEVAG